MCLYLNPHFNDLERKKQHYKLATYFCPAVNLEPPLDKNEVAIFKWGGISKRRGSRSKQENQMRGHFLAQEVACIHVGWVWYSKQVSQNLPSCLLCLRIFLFWRNKSSYFEKSRSWWAGLWPPPRLLYPCSYISECWIMFVHQTTLFFLLLMRS